MILQRSKDCHHFFRLGDMHLKPWLKAEMPVNACIAEGLLSCCMALFAWSNSKAN